MVEASHEKEQRAKETIHNLKVEIANLSKLVEQGAGMSINQENMVNNLVQAKNDLLKHRDMLQGQVSQLTNQSTALTSKVDALTKEKERESEGLQDLKEQLMEKLDADLKESRVLLDKRAEEIADASAEWQEKHGKLTKANHDLRDQRKESERLQTKMDSLEAEILSMKKLSNDEERAKKKAMQEHADTLGSIQMLDDDLKAIHKSKDKIHRQTERLQQDKGAQET